MGTCIYKVEEKAKYDQFFDMLRQVRPWWKDGAEKSLMKLIVRLLLPCPGHRYSLDGILCNQLAIAIFPGLLTQHIPTLRSYSNHEIFSSNGAVFP